MCRMYCQFHWHTGNHYSTELFNMLERFLLCTGSLNGVLLPTDAGKGKTVVFFFFLQGCDISLFISADVGFEMLFLAHGKYHIVSSCTQSSENLRLSWCNWFTRVLWNGTSESGFSILFLAVTISECKFKVVINFKTGTYVIFRMPLPLVKQIYRGKL